MQFGCLGKFPCQIDTIDQRDILRKPEQMQAEIIELQGFLRLDRACGGRVKLLHFAEIHAERATPHSKAGPEIDGTTASRH